MERQPHNNLWADKLLQVSMPDSGESWIRMEAVLDRKMPRRLFDRRRWFLLILLLLLLIGVCNCPGRGRLFRGASTPGALTPDPAAPAPAHAAPRLDAGTPGAPAAPASDPGAPASDPAGQGARRIPPGPVPMAAAPDGRTARLTPVSPEPGVHTAGPRKQTGNPKTLAAHSGMPAGLSDHGVTHPGTLVVAHPGTLRAQRGTLIAHPGTLTAHPGTVAARSGVRKGRGSHGGSRGGSQIAGHGHAGGHISGGPTEFADTTTMEATPPGAPPAAKPGATPMTKPGSPLAANAGVPPAANPGTPAAAKPGVRPAAKPAARNDSSQKKKTPPPPPVEDEKEKDHGWVIGIGLNQFFPIGGQRGSTYNSDGLTGTLSDYLPVPMVRYYLNRRTYIQLEAQLNTPQPTKKNLVISSPLPDTSTQGAVFTQVESSASIQQLYYFNIPLSMHYAISDNLNIGTGLQFSHLSNAIGEFDSTTTSTPFNSNNGNGTGANTTTAKTDVTKSFRGDTLYQRIKTNEFRLLLDVNYTYKHFVLGLRYNQALSNFINIQLPTGGTTQARNSSLQLYLRYIFLDTRKKKAKVP